MNFICFLSLDTVVSGGVVLVEWFIDFLRLCAVKSVHQGKVGAEFCGGKRVTEVIELTTSRKLSNVT